MSKQAQYEVELKEVNKEHLKEAVERMCGELDGIQLVNSRKNDITVKIPNAHYNARIHVKNGKVIVDTDSDVIRQYQRYNDRIKQFYEAVEISKEFNTEYDYNKQTEEIELPIQIA